MKAIIIWLAAVQVNPMRYSDELFAEGVELALPHLKSPIQREYYKKLLKTGRSVPAIRKKQLYNMLLRAAKITEKMLEKKSEQEAPEAPKVPEVPEVPKTPVEPEPPEVPEVQEEQEVLETQEVPEVQEAQEVPELPEVEASPKSKAKKKTATT
ncbi:MAG: hypothetical protein LBL94_05335 [Prevotellaceae bacterium]|jgi:hypothetical protein|nr:hypothetical protein [Prevotellaceae bacterium]